MVSLPSWKRGAAQVRAARDVVRMVLDDPAILRQVAGSMFAGSTADAGSDIPPPPAFEGFSAVASAEKTVAGSVEQVMQTLLRLDRLPEWVAMHVSWPADPPEAAEPGAVFAQQVSIMGIPADVRWTVADVTPTSVSLRGTGPMGIKVGFELGVVASADGSTVRFDAGMDGQPLRGPLGASIVRTLKTELASSLDALEHLMAGGAAARPVLHHATGVTVPANTPVLVGVGQFVGREPNADLDPASMAVRALREAEKDAGVKGLLESADTVLAVPSASWTYADAAALVAQAVGVSPERTVASSPFGGDGAQLLVNHAAQLIVDGQSRVALVVGAEAGATLAQLRAAGTSPSWPVQAADVTPDEVIGIDKTPNNQAETTVGLGAPIFMYALMETAVRRKAGRSPAEHQAFLGELWSRYSRVAAANPYAWSPTALEPNDIAEPSASNRMVSSPYTKLLCANLQVDLATGLVLCSAGAAEAAGIPQDKWVFLHAGASAHDEWFVTERADFATSPAIKALGDAALAHADLDISDIGHVDLYSCFPSAVQIGADALGLRVDDPERPLTVTGGLTFAGGPGNNYGSHAVASLVPRLRAEPESFGLSTSLGWYATKHALGIYSATPPESSFRHLHPAVDHPPARPVRTAYDGRCVVEAYTVPWTREGTPEALVISALAPSGERILLRSTDSVLVDEFLTADPLGWTLVVAGGSVSVVDRTAAALPAPPEPPVLVERRGPVAVITLNRPEVRNAIDARTAALLERAVDAFEADPAVRVGILTGAGDVFCSGMDLKAAARGELPYGEHRGLLGLTEKPPTKPLIAAVNGAALAGGCELALACDLIVAAEDVHFGIPEPKRGLVAAAGGVLRLAERLPRNVAMELAVTGDPMTAGRLAELGLVNRLAPRDKVVDVAIELAERIAANAPMSVDISRRIVREHADWTVGEAFAKQAELAAPAVASQDATEGVLAFNEKRDPVWKGV